MRALIEWAPVFAIIVPIAALVLALDGRASNHRKDLHAKIDALRATNDRQGRELHDKIDKHDRVTMAALGRLDTRISVIEDRSKRVRRGDQ